MVHLDPPKRFHCNAGSHDKVIYEPFFDENGARCLRAVGRESLHDFIQSFRDQTDINVILKRFQLGDVSALNVQHGFFGDFTNAPATLSDFLNAQIQANQLFDRLPADVRQAFDNDVNKFFVQYGSADWLKTVEPFMKQKESEVTE